MKEKMRKGNVASSLGENRRGFAEIQHISDETADLKRAAIKIAARPTTGSAASELNKKECL